MFIQCFHLVLLSTKQHQNNRNSKKIWQCCCSGGLQELSSHDLVTLLILIYVRDWFIFLQENIFQNVFIKITSIVKKNWDKKEILNIRVVPKSQLVEKCPHLFFRHIYNLSSRDLEFVRLSFFHVLNKYWIQE